MKTNDSKLLVTVWSYPGCTSLVITGTPSETKDYASSMIFGDDGFDASLLTREQKYLSDEELKALPEYDG